jgi:nicotinamidase-related amidase
MAAARMTDMPENVTPVEALLMIDIQAGHVSGLGAVPDAARLVENAADLLGKARASGALVVHVQNDGPVGKVDEPGTSGWELHLSVDPGVTEVVIRKAKDNAFDGTHLASMLTERGVRSVAICGLMSEMCVSATARAALSLGFRVVLPHDAHATSDVPAAPGISDLIPAATVSRVAEWALGHEIEIVPRSEDVPFAAPVRA